MSAALGTPDRLSSSKKAQGPQSAQARAFAVGWNDVQVRPFVERDLESVLDFYYRSPRDLPFIQDLDFGRLPPEGELRASWLKLISTGTVLTVEYKGRAVGIHQLANWQNGQADFWAFLWNSDVRGKGIVTVSWYKACQFFLEKFPELKVLLFKAPRSVPSSTKLAKKLPLKLVGSEELVASGFKAGVFADVYSVTRSEFESLHNEDSEEQEQEDSDDALDDADEME